jgi:hypothetical protein
MKLKLIEDGKEIIVKDGHTDVASAMKSVVTTIQHCEMIMESLNAMDQEESLPTWWTNKIAISEYEIVSAANYLSADENMQEEMAEEEM